MRDPATITVVNLSLRTAWLESGEQFPITNMFDEDGDETDDIDAVVAFVGRLPDGGWVTVDMREFEDASVN